MERDDTPELDDIDTTDGPIVGKDTANRPEPSEAALRTARIRGHRD
jgi:hypothetical protein